MDIRKDFQPVENLLQRLVQYASAFHTNNYTNWSHLKNNEDFDLVYRLDNEKRFPLERIYGTGRDLAGFMGSELYAFNYPEHYPTLKRFVDRFDGSWIDEIGDLTQQLNNAREIYDGLDHKPWAVGQMLDLFDSQISLLSVVKQTMDALKSSDIYKFDCGGVQATMPIPEYAKILECIQSIGGMFEKLPNTYKGKSEEELRDHILVSLEVIVEGSATGESFNKSGKTDILVRNNGENVFIAECKFWTGPSGFHETIDQLFRYLTWRDTKCALVIFVKNVNFTSVIESLPEHAKNHPLWIRTLPNTKETSFNFEFTLSKHDPRIINVSALFFHTPDA